MPRPKSLIHNIRWTEAARAHNCRHNDSHRIEKGQRRLTLKIDGDEHHYCENCAKNFLAADISRLQAILAAAEGEGERTPAAS